MKRFHFSLLTLLVGVVLAGGVGWLNMRPYPLAWQFARSPIFKESQYGWPFVALGYVHPSEAPEATVEYEKRGYRMLDPIYEWHRPGLAANIVIGLAIVLGGAAACELLMRRRAERAKT